MHLGQPHPGSDNQTLAPVESGLALTVWIPLWCMIVPDDYVTAVFFCFVLVNQSLVGNTTSNCCLLVGCITSWLTNWSLATLSKYMWLWWHLEPNHVFPPQYSCSAWVGRVWCLANNDLQLVRQWVEHFVNIYYNRAIYWYHAWVTQHLFH